MTRFEGAADPAAGPTEVGRAGWIALLVVAALCPTLDAVVPPASPVPAALVGAPGAATAATATGPAPPALVVPGGGPLGPVVVAAAEPVPPVDPTQPVVYTTDGPDVRARIAIDYALAQLGVPYVWGGDGPASGEGGFDCSGLTTAAYASAGIRLPRTAQTQWNRGPHVPSGSPLLPGDLVFYGTPDRVHHVGLYLGDGKMVNAPRRGKPVQVASVRYPGDDYLGATRPAALPGSLRDGVLGQVTEPRRVPVAPPVGDDFVAPAAPAPAAVPVTVVVPGPGGVVVTEEIVPVPPAAVPPPVAAVPPPGAPVPLPAPVDPTPAGTPAPTPAPTPTPTPTPAPAPSTTTAAPPAPSSPPAPAPSSPAAAPSSPAAASAAEPAPVVAATPDTTAGTGPPSPTTTAPAP